MGSHIYLRYVFIDIYRDMCKHTVVTWAFLMFFVPASVQTLRLKPIQKTTLLSELRFL